MCITYNLVDPKGELLASADTIGYLDGLVADLPPGRYTVDEIRDEPGPIGPVSRRRGAAARPRARRGATTRPGRDGPARGARARL